MYDTRKNTIGQLLGIELALYEHDLSKDSSNGSAMQKVREIAEVYANFASGGLEGFKEDFQKGYEMGLRDIAQDAESDPSFYSEPCPGFDGPS